MWEAGGFGVVDNMFFLGLTGKFSLTVLELLSNMPQLLFSGAYLLYNNVFTNIVLGGEFSSFARIRQSLRVTAPQGLQRSTYWLTLPYRFILPMTTMMALLHWTISRGLFLVQITEYNNPDHANGKTIEADLTWSPVPILVSVCIGGLLMLALAGFAMRRLQPGIPIVGSCSLAISAAANTGSNEKDAALKPLMYGAIVEPTKESQFKRVGLSSLEVERLANDEIYI